KAAEILGLAKEEHPPAKNENTTKTDASAIPRPIGASAPSGVTPAPVAARGGPAPKGKQPPVLPSAKSQTDTTPIHPRSRTQPVPTPEAEGAAFADEEVVGPDTVV